MLRDRIQRDSKAQHVSSHDEDQDYDLPKGHDFASHTACDELSAVGEGLHGWVCELELAD
jgi:hypothetical protein